MDEKELYYAMALTRISWFNTQATLQLYQQLGSAQAIYEHRGNIATVMGNCPPRLAEAMKDWDEPLRRAAAEMEFVQAHGIQVLAWNTSGYPQRLRECPDAPTVLYYKGTADLNQAKVVNIVGTRHCTAYGQDVIRQLAGRLRELCPQVLIVSGLAYGIDINAHRQALANGFETVGVLAHGLDYLYPPRHKETAREMAGKGGLLTEFMTQTNADKANFVRRNRIVAGMCDATILVESAARGGGLITAEIAMGYNRAVFAIPGPVGAPYSEGCNNLIRDNGAALLTSADDLVKAMGWTSDALLKRAQAGGIERNLFPDLSPEEQCIVGLLQKTNDLQLNIISVKANLPISQVSALLFQLEMKGVLKPLSGGMYHLLK